MCGRFNLTDSPDVIHLLKSFGFNTKGLRPRIYEEQYNIAPTESVIVAAQENGAKKRAKSNSILLNLPKDFVFSEGFGTHGKNKIMH